MSQPFFPSRPASRPMIYAYAERNPRYAGLLKVGYTEKDVRRRVAQQYPTRRPDGELPYDIVLTESAMYPDGSSFTDHDVHAALKRRGVACVGGEWFRCDAEDVRAAIVAVKTGTRNFENRIHTFSMRAEQERAVAATQAYYAKARISDPNRPPKFLWNAKMRFGKTFTTYQLAKRMGFRRVLVLTFKPAVKSAWEEDLMTHVDFAGWQFISKGGLSFEDVDRSRPFVCFGSFQDFLGVDKATGGIKVQNEWVHAINWDLVVFDEYHFGAWRENARKLFEPDVEDEYGDFDPEQYKAEEADNALNESFIAITTEHYLFLSGTPFRALHSGEFIEDQIYSWTYSDEQRAKAAWVSEDNPYSALPRMVLLTYRMPEEMQRIAKQGEFDEFDLNVFFSAKGKGKDARFVYEDYVQKWLDLIRGAYMPTTTDDLKLGHNEKPAMPYSDVRLMSVLSHTLWFLPNVASCHAMANLLADKQNGFYRSYQVIVCAGSAAGIGATALEPVMKAMDDPLNSKTITLTCMKLTTGVTVRPWSGIFMLRSLKTPETYFQAAFRVQSPWEVNAEDGRKVIIKRECYVFDFALDRALRQIADYSRSLNVSETNPEKKVGEFISFLPVLAYDGSTMKQVSAADILDIAMAGTSATLLARRWESAMLVNVDNETLKRLMDNEEAMAALMRIEGFRSLNQDIETIINKSGAVKKAKREGGENLTPKEKKALTDAEKEYKSKRKEIQNKLIKFATRIPIFMYLTDFREHSVKDVITQLEPTLFRRVTGLTVKDFELLVSLGVFNGPVMDDAVYKFRRYEEASLRYTGVSRHSEHEPIGLFTTTISREDYERMASQQSASMRAAPLPADDIPDAPIADAFDEEDEELEPAQKPPKRKEEALTRPPIVKRDASIVTYEPSSAPSAAAKPTKDYSHIGVGSRVAHAKFGVGTIRRIDKDLITVSFSGGEKRFGFPSAFLDGFLEE